MKIVQIFPGKVWGGAEQYVLDLGRALTARGHEVTYAARAATAVTARLDAERIPYLALPKGPKSAPEALGTLLARADIVHIHELKHAPMACKAVRIAGSGARTVCTRHIARGSRVWPWRRKAIRGLHRLIFVSDLARRLWSKANGWMPQELCVTVHNSIPDAKPDPSAPDLRKLYGIGSETPLLMMTGRVRESKGCSDIIAALRRLSHLPWEMVFVGACKPADYGEKLMREAAEAGIAGRIHLYGFTPDARSLVSQADIGLQPSRVREAFGLSQIEFMQAGKAVITTDNGAQPEYIIPGRTGLLVPPAEPDRLAEAILALLEDDSGRATGARAKAYFDSHLSYNLFVDKILQAYS